MSVSWKTSISNEIKVEEESLNELNVLLRILTIQTNKTFKPGTIVYRKYNSDGTISLNIYQ